MRKAFELRLPKKDIFKVPRNSNTVINSSVDVNSLLESWATNNKNITHIDEDFFESGDDVCDLKNLDIIDKNLMVFNHLFLEKQNSCKRYYVQWRQSNVDCFHLSQNYFKLPQQIIHENINFFCLFPQDIKNLSHIYQDHVAGDMFLKKFKDFCHGGWQQLHGFITIDISSSKCNGRYSHGLNEFYIPQYTCVR